MNLKDAQAQRTSSQPRNAVIPFPNLLKASMPQIAAALPKSTGIDPDRVARLALTAFRSNNKLAEAEPVSIIAAVITASQLGLEIGMNNEAHLVPYGRKAQLIVGYQGLRKLALNSGFVSDIYAYEVRAKDKFELTLGLFRDLKHEPLMQDGFPAEEEDRGPVVGFYAVAVMRDGTRVFRAMSAARVNAIRDGSKAYLYAVNNRKDHAWISNYIEMGCKTLIRHLCNKDLPKSSQMQVALDLDRKQDAGEDQGLTLEGAIDGEKIIVPDTQPQDEMPADDAGLHQQGAEPIDVAAVDTQAVGAEHAGQQEFSLE